MKSSILPTNVTAQAPAPKDALEQVNGQAEGGLPDAPCSDSLILCQKVGQALKQGFTQQGIPVIVENFQHGFALRLGGDIMRSFCVVLQSDSEEPDVGTAAYHPSQNREYTEECFARYAKPECEIAPVQVVREAEGDQVPVIGLESVIGDSEQPADS